jgi:hypothetical protein
MSMRRITYSTVERPSVLRRSERVLVFMVGASFGDELVRGKSRGR